MKAAQFAIRSNNFSLYEAFKKECEKIGYKYNDAFNFFDEGSMVRTNCLFFNESEGWLLKNKEGYLFAFSNSDRFTTFTLPKQWDEALSYVKIKYKEYKEYKEYKNNIVVLNNEYIAEIKENHINVGCQKIEFEKIKELYNKIYSDK